MKHKKMKIRPEVIVGILLLFVISVLTVGYASYSQILSLNGSSTFKHNGTVRITNFSVVDSSNLNTENHTINGTDVHFSANFNNVGNNATYYLVYEATVVNESFYAYDFANSSFVSDVTSTNSTVSTSYSVDGIVAGETLPSNSTKTFRIRLDVTLSEDHSGAINIGGDITNEVEQEYIGSLIGSISGSSTGDLENNNLASFNVNVINSYEYNKTINFALGNSRNFTLVDCTTGGAYANKTIPRNSTQTYTICVKKNDGVTFATSPQQVALYLTSTEHGNSSAGTLTLTVPVTIIVTDDDAPVISNVSATRVVGEKGKVNLTWRGTDDNEITNYYIEVHKTGEDPFIIDVLADDNPSYQFTDIEEGVGYYFVISGKDEFNNCVTGNPCGSTMATNPSTSSGTAVRIPATNTTTYSWTYSVSFNLNGMTYQGNTSVLEGKNYEADLSAQILRSLPSSLTITMAGRSGNLRKCSNANNCNGYTFSNGHLVVYNVTGNLNISGTAGTCLIKGTKVLLANGKYKNIEDVGYDDLLSVWDYKTGKLTYEYPIWIEQEKKTDHYQKTTFSDGTILKTYGGHAVFDLDKNMFVDINNKEEFGIGSKIAKIKDGKIIPVTATKIETINQKATYYHVVSTTYYNIIANDLLTTDDATILSNLYGFDKNITWPKQRNKIISQKSNLYKYEDINNSLPYYMFKGLRAEEAKYIVNMGYMSDEMLQYYFIMNQNNPNMVKEPITKNGSRYWQVSIDDQKYGLIKEGEEITLPNAKVSCYFNTSDSKCYKPNDKIKIYYGTHFITK